MIAVSHIRFTFYSMLILTSNRTDILKKIEIYDTFNPEIYRLIGSGINVLDVGCGTGLLGKHLKQEKKCQVFGIELNEDAADLAAKMYDKVIVSDVEKFNDLQIPLEYFDVIVFADILEHTKMPHEILCHFKKYLSPSGFVLISVPNVAHWRMRLNLLSGNFNYLDRGVLDRTHLRFFTQRTLEAMLIESGFKILNITGHGFLCSNIWKGFLASFFVVKAVPLSKEKVGKS